MKEKTLAYKIEELKKMLPDGNPVGITFKTQNGYYYYDTVTGKVLACQKVEYEIIEKIAGRQTGGFWVGCLPCGEPYGRM